MIVFFVTDEGRITIRSFLETWGSALEGLFRVVPYTRSMGRREDRPGAYVFSDLERLSPGKLEAASRLWEKLERLGGATRLLNDPRKVLLRYDLLRALFERGINRFTVHRYGALDGVERYPVFLRNETDHMGNRSPLLHGRSEVRAAVKAAPRRELPRKRILITEFVDTADSHGVYRKYSAFRVGDRIVARHIFYSKHWMVKNADLADPSLVEEEYGYVRGNPHRDTLKKIFDIARITYGRIDYAMAEGKPQVWEINTNPMIASDISSRIPARHPTHVRFVREICAAFRSFDELGRDAPPGGGRLPEE
jgi:hypothetical protein